METSIQEAFIGGIPLLNADVIDYKTLKKNSDKDMSASSKWIVSRDGNAMDDIGRFDMSTFELSLTSSKGGFLYQSVAAIGVTSFNGVNCYIGYYRDDTYKQYEILFFPISKTKLVEESQIGGVIKALCIKALHCLSSYFSLEREVA